MTATHFSRTLLQARPLHWFSALLFVIAAFGLAYVWWFIINAYAVSTPIGLLIQVVQLSALVLISLTLLVNAALPRLRQTLAFHGLLGLINLSAAVIFAAVLLATWFLTLAAPPTLPLSLTAVLGLLGAYQTAEFLTLRRQHASGTGTTPPTQTVQS